MPVVRGVRYRLVAPRSAESLGVVVLTSDTWNQTMSQVGVVVIRSELLPIEEPHAVPLASGGFAVIAAD